MLSKEKRGKRYEMKAKIMMAVIFLIIVIVAASVTGANYEAMKQPEEVEEWKLNKFDLRDKIPYKIEYQIKDTYLSCWCYAGLDSIETNLALHKGVNYDFSEIYVDYMTSTLLGGEREYNSGASSQSVYIKKNRYKGPVLESQVPNRFYTPEEYPILYEAKPIVTKIDWTVLSENAPDNLLEAMKKHIVENGSVNTGLYFDPLNEDVYNDRTFGYYSPEQERENHLVSIIGWDDDYPKENFPEKYRPESDGAYLVNPFWKDYENDGLIYVPYEDKIMIKNMIGVTSCRLYNEK